jgi:hypothetical protein
MSLLLESIEAKPQLNRNVVTDLIIITDSEEVFRLARLKPPTVLYINQSMSDVHIIFDYLRFSYTVMLNIINQNLMMNYILPICAAYIIQMESQDIYITLHKDIPSLNDVYQEVKDYVLSGMFVNPEDTRRYVSKTHLEYCNSFLVRYVSHMATNFYPVMHPQIVNNPHYNDDINKWRSYYEVLLNDKYKTGNEFREIINSINYKRYIETPKFVFFRPLLVYIIWLLDSLGELPDTLSERFIEFLYHVSYYLQIRKGLHDGI